jgi:hypothetical protein
MKLTRALRVGAHLWEVASALLVEGNELALVEPPFEEPTWASGKRDLAPRLVEAGGIAEGRLSLAYTNSASGNSDAPPAEIDGIWLLLRRVERMRREVEPCQRRVNEQAEQTSAGSVVGSAAWWRR